MSETTEQLQVGDWTRHRTEEQAAQVIQRREEEGWKVQLVDRGSGTIYRYSVTITEKADQCPE